MNPNKICFIICINNDIYAEECLNYINRLIVPDDFSYEVITITEAVSMLSGYKDGCSRTDAQYKIFMHQDVFILNLHFLEDIINIFKADGNIRMIGMVGTQKMPDNFIMWSDDLTGNLFSYGCETDYTKYKYDITSDNYTDVVSVDGFLMAINGEPVLRDDMFDGWDFYDISMSYEIRRQGYRIVVPNQRMPWCMHDDGDLLSMLDYDHYRNIAIKEYGDK